MEINIETILFEVENTKNLRYCKAFDTNSQIDIL